MLIVEENSGTRRSEKVLSERGNTSPVAGRIFNKRGFSRGIAINVGLHLVRRIAEERLHASFLRVVKCLLATF